MRTSLVLLLALTLCAPSFARRRSPYKYSIDPARAEQILAGLSSRDRLDDGQYLKLLGNRKTENLEVISGDTLWDLSQKIFGNGFMWRKLWQVNSTISNPHDISVGDKLSLYSPSRGLASEEIIRIPLIKLVPNEKNAITDLDNDKFVNADIKNRFRPNVFVLKPEDEILGEITGSHTEREMMYFHEPVYIKDLSEKMKLGDRFAVIRVERELRDQTQIDKPVVGTLVRMVGEVKIIEKGETLLKADVVSIYETINRGHKLVRLQPPVSASISNDPPSDLQARIVMGEFEQARYFAQGSLVLLNKGKEDGMEEGYIFRVWQDMDEQTKKTSGVEPQSKGEVRVIHVGRLSSIGIVMRNLDTLTIGDTLVPRQAFTNRPPSPKFKIIESTEIDDE